MRKLWMSVSAEDSQHMINMLDVDHDNRVSMEEFRRFVYLLPESLVRRAADLYTHSRSADLIMHCTYASWVAGCSPAVASHLND